MEGEGSKVTGVSGGIPHLHTPSVGDCKVPSSIREREGVQSANQQWPIFVSMSR